MSRAPRRLVETDQGLMEAVDPADEFTEETQDLETQGQDGKELKVIDAGTFPPELAEQLAKLEAENKAMQQLEAENKTLKDKLKAATAPIETPPAGEDFTEQLARLEALEAENRAMRERLSLYGDRDPEAQSRGPRALVGMVKAGGRFVPVKRVLDTPETRDNFHKEAYEKGFEGEIRVLADGEDVRMLGWPKGPINITPDVPGAIAVPEETDEPEDDESTGAWA